MKNWMWLLLGAGVVYFVSRPASASLPAPTPAPGPTPPPTNDAARQLVMAAQRVLRELGYYPGAIDGIAGSNTRAAAAAYLQDRPALLTRLSTISSVAAREQAALQAIAARRDS